MVTRTTQTGKPNGPKLNRAELIDLAQLLVGLMTFMVACGAVHR